MEKEGLVRSLNLLKSEGLKVQLLVTDRHTQITKYMRDEYPEVDHRYDVSHVAKCKKMNLLMFYTLVLV